MNPQMQQYRHGAYPQGQPRGAPAARRPGECDSSTNTYIHPDGISPNQIQYNGLHMLANAAGRQVLASPSGLTYTSPGMFARPVTPNSKMRQPDAIPGVHYPVVNPSPVNYLSPWISPHPGRQTPALLQAHVRTEELLRMRVQNTRPLPTQQLQQRAPHLYNPRIRHPHESNTSPRESREHVYPPLQPHELAPPRTTPPPTPIEPNYLPDYLLGGPMPPNTAYAQHPNAAAAAAAAQHQQQMQTATAQQRHAMMEHQSAQRRAKKPTDKTLPDGIDELLVTPSLAQQYRDLRDAERRLDYTMTRKRTDLQDTFNRTVKRQKTMRVWITNTAENQPWQGGGLDEDAFDFASGADPTFRVRIEGRLLDDDDEDVFASSDDEEEDEDKATRKQEEKNTKIPDQKFTHFFKGLSVEYDRARQGNLDTSMAVEWKKPGANFSDVDEISFSRKGDENMNITINLVRDESPERYRLSHALAQTLDMDEADRAETVMGLWEYVKLMGLQEDEEKRSIRCDEMLRQIFGREQVYFPQIPELIMPHLHPLPPIKLAYTIRLDQAFQSSPEPTIYDIRVSVDDPIRAKVIAMIQNPEYVKQLREIARLDDELAVVIQAIHHSKSKHAFYKAMARDPVGFTKKWMSSQQRDLEVILGEAARGGGEDGMGVEFARGGEDGVWGSDLTREAVRYMLAKDGVKKA